MIDNYALKQCIRSEARKNTFLYWVLWEAHPRGEVNSEERGKGKGERAGCAELHSGRLCV